MNAVLRSAHGTWTATDWSEEVRQASLALAEAGSRVVATLLDNGAAFVAIDEAALADGVVHVPLPAFFTAAQVAHAMDAAGVDTPGTAKVTFTSGTTGQPKGVCLGAAALDAVAQSLVHTLGPLGIECHLSVLPYAVLLENVAGSMAARCQGATLISMPAAAVGLSGSSKFDPAVLDRTVREQQAGSLILLPQMLRAWCAFLATSGQRASGSLRFVAVGGAAVGAPLLGQARSLGIPAFEGYGLSEACSVQCLNLPGADRAGSVGRVLPHGEVRVTATGEIEVRGSLHLGYLGDTEPVPPWWPTGDLGHVDDDGYLFIEGRRKNVLITGFGRNVS
ncbi:MAG: AMP-binding protein, partial [Hydrogenophaga sp.]|nr:AMP-binding protein [Hydrogenophaga sp.]